MMKILTKNVNSILEIFEIKIFNAFFRVWVLKIHQPISKKVNANFEFLYLVSYNILYS